MFSFACSAAAAFSSAPWRRRRSVSNCSRACSISTAADRATLSDWPFASSIAASRSLASLYAACASSRAFPARESSDPRVSRSLLSPSIVAASSRSSSFLDSMPFFALSSAAARRRFSSSRTTEIASICPRAERRSFSSCRFSAARRSTSPSRVAAFSRSAPSDVVSASYFCWSSSWCPRNESRSATYPASFFSDSCRNVKKSCSTLSRCFCSAPSWSESRMTSWDCCVAFAVMSPIICRSSSSDFAFSWRMDFTSCSAVSARFLSVARSLFSCPISIVEAARDFLAPSCSPPSVSSCCPRSVRSAESAASSFCASASAARVFSRSAFTDSTSPRRACSSSSFSAPSVRTASSSSARCDRVDSSSSFTRASSSAFAANAFSFSPIRVRRDSASFFAAARAFAAASSSWDFPLVSVWSRATSVESSRVRSETRLSSVDVSVSRSSATRERSEARFIAISNEESKNSRSFLRSAVMTYSRSSCRILNCVRILSGSGFSTGDASISSMSEPRYWASHGRAMKLSALLSRTINRSPRLETPVIKRTGMFQRSASALISRQAWYPSSSGPEALQMRRLGFPMRRRSSSSKDSEKGVIRYP